MKKFSYEARDHASNSIVKAIVQADSESAAAKLLTSQGFTPLKLKELNEDGITIFFSSHIVSDVEEICNKVIFIEKGKLLYDGDIDSLLLKHSSEQYRLKYVKNSNIEIIYFLEKDKNQILKLFQKNIL